MNKEALLLIFVKNPTKGKVKTRLAQTVGDDKALVVYQKLLEHTHLITRNLDCDKALFYSDFIDDHDLWDNRGYSKYIQEGSDLGDKMLNAFRLAFEKGYKQVVIIGSDCYQLQTEHLKKAFNELKNNEIVIGPAYDGGYYLLGMKKFQEQFFKNKKWSTENIFLDTLLDAQNARLRYALLDTLSDVDYASDLEDDLRSLIK